MDTFSQIWESSRHNAWSLAYPFVIVTGVFSVIVVSTIRSVAVRRCLLGLVFLVFAYLATEASFQAVSEKWRIRQEWTQAHFNELTEKQQETSVSDGANLVVQPPVDGFFALMIFIGTAIVMRLVRQSRLTGNTSAASNSPHAPRQST